MAKTEMYELQQMQSLPLELKIIKTQQRIREWYEKYNGNVYISFSGGKDSTVLLHIARQIYPDIEGVFVNTGLEYPEVRQFVNTFDKIIHLKPTMPFYKVIEKYGYPVISKEQAQYIREYRTTKSEKLKQLRWNGNDNKRWKISEKWKNIVNAPFKISEQCCDVMKKKPFREYEKKNGNKPIIGVMAEESAVRKRDYLKFGCNAFEAKKPISRPLGFWTEQDILQYLKTFSIRYASVYGEIKEDEKTGKLYLTGEQRTGCMFCMFGVHMEKEPNRFQRMKITHPKQYDYCINKLGCGEVLDYINVNY